MVTDPVGALSAPSAQRSVDSVALIGDSHRALTDLVLEALRQQIILGERRSGERLVETDLADAFGVSRNPVREAIKLLSAEGFVNVSPRRSAVVAEITQQEAEHVFDVREALEAAAAAGAARLHAQRPPNLLGRLLDEQEAIYSGADAKAKSDANAEFHHAVAVAAGNPYLLKLLVPLRWKIAWIYQLSANIRGTHSLAEHRMLAEAIDRGSEADARSLTAYHIRKAKEAYLDSVKQA